MTYQLTVNEMEKEMIEKCAVTSGSTAEDFIHDALVEKLEDVYDLLLLKKAIIEDEGDSSVGYSLEEAGRILGLR